MTNKKIKDINTTAKIWLHKKRELEKLEQEFGSIDAELKDLMHECGVVSVSVEDSSIELKVQARRSFDAATLKALIKPALFNKITKPAVDSSLIDAAVKMGDISEDVLEKVTKKTEYKQLRVK
jgi:hypothetical protein